MGTRAVYTFIDSYNEFHVYGHWDGDPQSVVEKISNMLKFAWPLPRFEADECAAAFIAGNKKEGGGDIYLTSNYTNHDDLSYRYEISCVDNDLYIKVFDFENKNIFEGSFDNFKDKYK